jgi:hypothetical protein
LSMSSTKSTWTFFAMVFPSGASGGFRGSVVMPEKTLAADFPRW